MDESAAQEKAKSRDNRTSAADKPSSPRKVA